MAIIKNQKLITFFLLLIIIGIAAFFRLWQLGSIPSGLYPDVALNGNEALDKFKVFYPDNNGREGLMMWLITFSFSIFGISVWSIKIVAALAGALTVFGLYLLSRELFSKYSERCSRNIALLASLFLATSFWHANFSRIGFRAILLPLVSVFAFYFLFRGFRTKKLLSLILSGLFFGLGFYTYTSYRMIVLLSPLLLFCLYYLRKDKKTLLYTICFILTTALVALPLGLYFLWHPQDFMSRMTGVSVFAAASPVVSFGESLIKHLGMFNFFGDPNWRHNFAGSPMLPWPLGILFLIGFFLSIRKIILAIKNKSHQELMVPIFLISWFFAMLLPGALTREGLPHALRVVGVIPSAYIFVSLGAYWFYQKISARIKQKKLLFSLCLLFLSFTVYGEFNKYFFVWAENSNVQGAFTKNYVEIGNRLNSLPDSIQKYVIVNEGGVPVGGIPVSAQTIIFIEKTKNRELKTIYLLPEDLDKIMPDRPTAIIPMKYEEKLFNRIQEKFPQGKIIEQNGIFEYEIE